MNTATISHTSQPASRWTVIIASVATIALTSGFGYLSSAWLADRQTVRTEQINEINRFLKTTEAFEPLVRAHMRNLLDGESIEKTNDALSANIQEQHIELDAVRSYVPLELRPASDRYADILVSTADAVNAARSPLTAAPLMQQANDAVLAKRRLASALRKGAGLPE